MLYIIKLTKMVVSNVFYYIFLFYNKWMSKKSIIWRQKRVIKTVNEILFNDKTWNSTTSEKFRICILIHFKFYVYSVCVCWEKDKIYYCWLKAKTVLETNYRPFISTVDWRERQRWKKNIPWDGRVVWMWNDISTTNFCYFQDFN